MFSEVLNGRPHGVGEQRDHSKPHGHVIIVHADSFIKNVQAGNGYQETSDNGIVQENDSQDFPPREFIIHETRLVAWAKYYRDDQGTRSMEIKVYGIGYMVYGIG